MFANIRDAFNQAAQDVSQRFDQNRQRRPGDHIFSPTTQTRESQPQGHPPQTQRAPPASIKAIKQLPTIRVAPEDLVDPNNRECCVCLDDNKLGDKVTRLPCAHIFHTSCIVDWLANHSCTCPVCRYELPTDDLQFEAGRIERMQSRKPRYAMHELKRMSISELLDLSRQPTSGVLEKEDLIKMLIEKNHIDLIPSPEPVEYNIEVLRNMKISELKRAMAEAGVFFRREDVLMKSDMISVFQNSGRLILIETGIDDNAITLDNHGASIKATVNDDCLNSSILSFNEEDQILVETVLDDSTDLTKDTANEEQGEQTIEMFPNQYEENTEYETRDNSMSVSPTISSTHNPSPAHSNTENTPRETSSVASNNQNPVLTESRSQHHAVTENISADEEFSDANGNHFDLVFGSGESIISDAQQRDITENMIVDQGISESDSNQYVYQIGPELSIQPEREGQTVSESTFVDEEFSDADGNHDAEMGSDQSILPEIETQEQIGTNLDNSSTANNLVNANSDLRSTFQHYTINHLQTLGRDLQIDLSNCIERDEMIEIFVNDSVKGCADPSVLSQLMFSSWSVSQLRVIASKINLNISECTSKDEMIEMILYAANIERPYLRNYLRSLSPLTTRSLSDLRAIAREFQINISDCLEKDEIIHRLMARAH